MPTSQMMIFSFRKQFDECMMRVYNVIYQCIKYINHQNIVLSTIIKSVGIYTMTIQEAKQIRIADYLQSMGYSPVKQQGNSLWYKSPLREETKASFKVNIELNPCDFGIGRGRKRQNLTVNPPPRNIVKPKKKGLGL